MQIKIALEVGDRTGILVPTEPFNPKTATVVASKASLRRWMKAIEDFDRAQKEMSEALDLNSTDRKLAALADCVGMIKPPAC